ncbi:MAG TPA: 3-methyl-2-oxobutanoate hydroxymethyltransferase [bacterium]|jgi:3-methyl-2-oxobutanoate hydroxymethyltransferase
MTTGKVTVRTIRALKKRGQKSVWLTAYDYPTALLIDQAGIDGILVGDSLGMVVQGHSTTLPVTLDEIIYHCRMVSRGSAKAMVVGDMPFGSFQGSTDAAIENAIRLVKEGNCEAVKFEGAGRNLELMERLVNAGIPVMAHLGLLPQSIHAIGGFKVQGKVARAAEQLLLDAKRVESAGAFSLVLECIPQEVAKMITAELEIPTIGIGAGKDCDGQILVFHDVMDLLPGYQPRFVRKYAHLGNEVVNAAKRYIEDVRSGEYPSNDESFSMKDHDLKKMFESPGLDDPEDAA